MAEFTPGTWVAIPSNVRLKPWNARNPIHSDGRWVILPEYEMERLPIAEVDKGDDMHAPTRARAEWDARLIAAAPDLYDACQSALADLEPHEWADLPGGYAVKATVDALREAISKAEGEDR